MLLEEIEAAKRETTTIQEQLALARQQCEKAYAGVEEARKAREKFAREAKALLASAGDLAKQLDVEVRSADAARGACPPARSQPQTPATASSRRRRPRSRRSPRPRVR